MGEAGATSRRLALQLKLETLTLSAVLDALVHRYKWSIMGGGKGKEANETKGKEV